MPDWLPELYFRHVADEDLAAIGSRNATGIVRSHLELAQHRESGRANIRIMRPTIEHDGWSTSYAVLQIVTDDMPFLVDSVVARLSSYDRSVHLLIHPQLTVARDASGDLLEVLRDADGDDTKLAPLAESWMYFEIDLAADPAADDALVGALHDSLGDVRAAVDDWDKMQARCDSIVADLEAHPPATVPLEEVHRTQEFLRWLADEHFTFLGYREYTLDQIDGEDVIRPVPSSGLGILRYDQHTSSGYSRLTPKGRATAREPRLLILTKANARATVHRPVYLDYVGIKTFDSAGNVTGERRFLGLLSSSAYAESVRSVPVLRDRVSKVLSRSGYSPQSHSGKDLVGILEAYPRDELFQTSSEQLYETATKVLRLQERRQAHLFRRADDYGRFVSVLAYLPRDRYNTAVRLRIERILKDAYDAETVDFTTRVTESPLALIHYVVRMRPGQSIPEVSDEDLQRRLFESTLTWGERMTEVARGDGGDDEAARVSSLYSRAYPEAYKEDFTPRQGVADLRHVEALKDFDDTLLTLYRQPGADERERRFKLFRGHRLILTDVLPIFTDLGVEVIDERPYEMKRADGVHINIYDFGLRVADGSSWGDDDTMADTRERFQDAFHAVWRGEAESDGLGALVLRAGLTWQQVAWLRAITKYLRQVGFTLSQAYVEQALVSNAHLSAKLVEMFEVRHDPGRDLTLEQRDEEQARISRDIDAGLDQVASLDHDRIIRAIRGVIAATLRTNAFQHPAAKSDGAGDPRTRTVSMKLDCAKVPELPSPKPMFEIWVYSPRVEGVHLRFGKVARGGLRWSDRREDFRTEILGLVKAQMVKNAVIVPTGSKGGFFPKQLPDSSDRDAWLAEGIASYKMFISGLLDLTDNLVDGQVVPPENVVRHDPDDTYLVVAADKGTAKFSDIANGVAQSYGYWLDDAFASGGSAGYDHKAMGITARGAWESVKRHFREMGHDTQTENFTVVGVGDMSGDVFGNGMLLSEHIRLVAAFDHRDIFLDPAPDPATSFQERRRMFDLPRSSWQDYDKDLLSQGGGIYSRQAKSIPISDQVRAALGIDDGVTSMTPAQLMKAILLAPVDLFWNGGIGTYIKASTESNADIGDRANDAVRVNGEQLRCQVVGEGGNLGVSQLGRIEAAQHGVRINTDAIDNSAGVDTSDHEVNIKILLTELMRQGRFDLEARNTLLHSMTDDIAELVLRDNYEQNTLLGNARFQNDMMAPVHVRLMHWLEERGELDRSIEFLPSDATMKRRQADGQGLTSPECSVLLAYSKLALKADLATSELTDDPWFETSLSGYFPDKLSEKFAGDLASHPLRREIIINRVVNSMINRGGITFAFRVQEETGAGPEQTARAFVIAREVFGLSEFVAAVEALDNVVPTQVQTQLYLEFRRLMDRATRWFIHNRPERLDVRAEIERFGKVVAKLSPKVPDMLRAGEHDRWQANADGYVADGVPQQLAEQTAGLLDCYSLLDITEQATRSGADVEDVAKLYFALSESLGIDVMLQAISALPRDDRWDALARGAIRDDLYGVLDSYAAAVVERTDGSKGPDDRLAQWSNDNAAMMERARHALDAVTAVEHPGLAPLSVALRTLRGVIRSGAAV